jgi:copper/silver efflux system protein
MIIARYEGLIAAVARVAPWIVSVVAVLAVGWMLTTLWEPLGPERGLVRNGVFVTMLVGGLLAVFFVFQYVYAPILRFCLNHKILFLALPTALVLLGSTVWLGFDRVFGFVPTVAGHVGLQAQTVRTSGPWSWAVHQFPGLGREFMPPLDEGAFLWMPTTMPHASSGRGH